MSAPANPLIVLLIDDEIYDYPDKKYSVLINQFKKQGDINIEVAENGTEALDKLRTMVPAPDIIVLDIMMPPGEELVSEPVKDGYETGFVLLRKIRDEMDLKMPAIILTNYPMPLSADEEAALGVVRYLEKPIMYAKLIRIIREETGRGEC